MCQNPDEILYRNLRIVWGDDFPWNEPTLTWNQYFGRQEITSRITNIAKQLNTTTGKIKDWIIWRVQEINRWANTM